MLSFYTTHISPSSPTRAKLSVHLTAQSKPAPSPLPDLQSRALAVLQTIANLEHTPVDADALKARIDAVTEASDIPAVVGKFLEERGMESAKREEVVDEVGAALGLAEGGVGEVRKVEEVGVEGAAEGEPVLITDVRAFKAGLFASHGVKVVRSLEEFVEGGAKL